MTPKQSQFEARPKSEPRRPSARVRPGSGGSQQPHSKGAVVSNGTSAVGLSAQDKEMISALLNKQREDEKIIGRLKEQIVELERTIDTRLGALEVESRGFRQSQANVDAAIATNIDVFL